MKFIYDNFDLLFDKAGSVGAFKKLILEMAVRGKLVPQDPNDEPATVLLDKIQKEKEQLIKEGALKKEKPLPSIREDEMPFDLPDGWEWARLKEICYNFGQKKPDKEFTYIDVGSIDQNHGTIKETLAVIEPKDAPSRARKMVKTGTLIYSTVRPYLLNIAIVDKEFVCEPIASTAFAVMNPFNNVEIRYLYYYLRSDTFTFYVSNQMVGMAYPAINDANLFKGHFPLPPLNEQKRIVQKIDEIFEMIPKFQKALVQSVNYKRQLNQTSLNTLTNTSNREEFINSVQFVANNFDSLYDTTENIKELRQAILTLAVQGKLVPQDLNDEPASILLEKIQKEKERLVLEGQLKKEKPLPPIKEDEIPFDLPSGWEWFRLSDVSIMIADLNHEMPRTTNDLVSYPYISPTDFTSDDGIDFKNSKKIGQEDFYRLSKRIKPEKGDIIFPRYGTIGVVRFVEVDFDFLVSYSCATIKTVKLLSLPRYIYYYCQSGVVKNEIIKYVNRTTQPNVGITSIKKFMLPVPPLFEQKRIVEKIDMLMALCDDLENRIAKCNKINDQLLDTVLHEAFADVS